MPSREILPNEEYVICPICGRKLRRLIKHTKAAHNVDRSELELMYPGIKVSTDESFKIRSEISKRTCSDPEFKRQHSDQFKKMHLDGHNQSEFMRNVSRRTINSKFFTPEARKKAVLSRQATYENDKEFQRKVLESLDKGRKTSWSNPEYREMMKTKGREALVDKWANDPDYRYKMENCRYIARPHPHLTLDGTELVFRSSWELKFAYNLELQGIKYDYESLRIKRSDNHVYTPDFYLPDYNLVCEVHPYKLIDETMIDKMNFTIQAGYRFIFVTRSLLEAKIEDLVSMSLNVT